MFNHVRRVVIWLGIVAGFVFVAWLHVNMQDDTRPGCVRVGYMPMYGSCGQ